MKKCLPILILSLSFVTAKADSTIDSVQLSENAYQLTLISDRELTISEAQSQLSKSAATACDQRAPEFGQYKFKSSTPVDSSIKNQHTTFEFIQNITCVKPGAPFAQKQPRVITREKRAQISSEVKIATETHFSSLAAGDFDNAYKDYSAYLKKSYQFVQWREKQLQFSTEVGKPVSGGAWNVTVYVDPVSAPTPGLYVKADYQYAYEGVPYRCGYLVWYSELGLSYEIVRQEDGTLRNEILDDLSDADLKRLKARFLCSAD